MFLVPPQKGENLKNYSHFIWTANRLWKSDDESINSMDDLAKINYTQNAYTEPLKSAFARVYGTTDGAKLFDYIVSEYRLEYTNPLKNDRINDKILILNGIELKNYNDNGFKIQFATNIKK